MDAIELFLRDHARTHSSAVGGAEGNFFIEDGVFGGLTDDQMRTRPQEGTNSLAWLLWHMARTEDMAVNIIVAGRREALEEDGWRERLGIARKDIGTGMSDDEVADFTPHLDISVLRAYRAAVGRRTRDFVAAMRAEELDAVIDTGQLERAFAEGAIDERATWLRWLIGGKTKAFMLGHGATGHNFIHIGEAMTVRSLLGLRLPV